MCQYSADQTGPPRTGAPNEWHHLHLVTRAIGGAGLIVVEATAVSPQGRTSPADFGLWNDTQASALADLVHDIERFGSVAGIQLGHAGRKGSSTVPWQGKHSIPAEDPPLGWHTLAPSAVPFGHFAVPQAATKDDIAQVIDDFRTAARRAHTDGFKVIELHAAHGYLIHQFLSPESNTRTDEYGGPFDNRIRLLLEVADAVRESWPATLPPLFVRLSATDWTGEEKGIESMSWTPEQSVMLAHRLREHGVDLIDVSTGGNPPRPRRSRSDPDTRCRSPAASSRKPGSPPPRPWAVILPEMPCTGSVGCAQSPMTLEHPHPPSEVVDTRIRIVAAGSEPTDLGAGRVDAVALT